MSDQRMKELGITEQDVYETMPPRPGFNGEPIYNEASPVQPESKLPERAQAAVPADREEFENTFREAMRGISPGDFGYQYAHVKTINVKTIAWRIWQAARLSQAQPDIQTLRYALHRAITELSFVESVENCTSGLCATDEGRKCIAYGMKALGVTQLFNDDESPTVADPGEAQPLVEQVELPPLDVTEEDWKYGRHVTLHTTYYYSKVETLASELHCRERQLFAALAKAEALPVRSEWRSVDQELPPKNEVVDVFTASGERITNVRYEYNGGSEGFWDWHFAEEIGRIADGECFQMWDIKVTHWKPLDDPPVPSTSKPNEKGSDTDEPV